MSESLNLISESQNSTEDPRPNIELAGRWARFVASLIDATIGGTLIFLLTNALGYYDNLGIANPDFFERFTSLLIGMSTVVVVQSYFLYRYGQTIGKMWLGIRIASLNGNVPSLARLLCLRKLPVSFLTLAPGVGSFLPIADILFILRPDRRCLHDLVAGTRVVKTERGPKTWLIGSFALSALVSALYMLIPVFVFFSLDSPQQFEVMQYPDSLEQHLPAWAIQKSLPPGFGASPKQAYINTLDRRCTEGRQVLLGMFHEREKLEEEGETLYEECKQLIKDREIEKARDICEKSAEKSLLAIISFIDAVSSVDQLYKDLRIVAAPRANAETLKHIWDYQSQTIAKLSDIAECNLKPWRPFGDVPHVAETKEEERQRESLIDQRFAELEAITQKQSVLAKQYGFNSCFIDNLGSPHDSDKILR